MLKNLLLGAALAIALTMSTFADQSVPAKDFIWPNHTLLVRCGTVIIDCEWMDGRPMAASGDLARFLHVPQSESARGDLINAMIEKGWLVRQGHDGAIEMVSPKALESNERNASRGNQLTPYRRMLRSAPPGAAALKSESLKVIADTGYLRSLQRITNTGSAVSPACICVGEFQDWGGVAFAEHRLPLKALQPGESVTMEFFSLVHHQDQSDKWQCKPRYENVDGSTAAVKNRDNPYRSNATNDFRPGMSDPVPLKSQNGPLLPTQAPGDFKAPDFKL